MKLLFRTSNLQEFLENHKINMIREIQSCEHDYLLNVSIDDYCEFLISKYSVDAPTIHEQGLRLVEKEEVKKNGYGKPTLQSASMLTGDIDFVFSIPFSGNSALFNTRPSRFNSNPPSGVVKRNNEIEIHIRSRAYNESRLERELRNQINSMQEYLGWIKTDVAQHNEWFTQNTKNEVNKRRQQVLDILGFIEKLNIPLQRNENMTSTFTIPISRKKINVIKPNVITEPYQPEPTLANTEYEYILETLLSMSLAMERSPRTFTQLKEEEIRDFFLIVLNSHYQGQATGETFNNTGKTDILLRYEDRNAFIAECKIWKGKKSILDTIDQIMKYSNWRDTKTAILIFNKNIQLSLVLSELVQIIPSHKYFKRENRLERDSLNNETTFSYVFHQQGDKNREFLLTVMVYDIPRIK